MKNNYKVILNPFRQHNAKRSSIAAGGGFYNVQPGTAAWLYSSAETVADSGLQPIAPTSCPTLQHTFVSSR